MWIADLRPAAEISADAVEYSAMKWFESAARIVLIAAAVLIGATVVRNVTDALTEVAQISVAAIGR